VATWRAFEVPWGHPCRHLRDIVSERGLFFGNKLPIKQEIIRFARKYHGYFFARATIYTFWYHPIEPTSGHIIGFFYMFLLLLQGSLFFTRIHTNRW
jgi:hypothetical protein